MPKFEFKKTFKEIDINGEIYRVSFDDEAMDRYMDVATDARDEFKALDQFDVENASKEELHGHRDKQKEAVKKVIEAFLGEESFDGLYEMAGRSVLNLMSLVSYLIDLYEQEQSEALDVKKDKYLKKKK
jgi:hypothetical protein